MGISYSAQIFVGLPYDELSDIEGLDEAIDCGDYEVSSCYYDSPRNENIVGICVSGTSDWDYTELDLEDFMLGIAAAKTAFRDEFHRQPKIYLTPCGS